MQVIPSLLNIDKIKLNLGVKFLACFFGSSDGKTLECYSEIPDSYPGWQTFSLVLLLNMFT